MHDQLTYQRSNMQSEEAHRRMVMAWYLFPTNATPSVDGNELMYRKDRW